MAPQGPRLVEDFRGRGLLLRAGKFVRSDASAMGEAPMLRAARILADQAGEVIDTSKRVR